MLSRAELKMLEAHQIIRERDKRIVDLETERDGLNTFIAKQAAAVRALQRRLNRAGLDDKLPGKAEREQTPYPS